MQTVRVYGASIEGTGALIVTVEARFERAEQGATDIQLTGLPDPVLRESRGRLACILAAGRVRPGPGRLHLHLVPAARRKSGEGLDLALVVAAAAAAGYLPPKCVEGTLFLGEVGIDGRLFATPGGLAAGVTARASGIGEVIAPPETASEVAALSDVRAYAAADLAATLALLTASRKGEGAPTPVSPPATGGAAGTDPSSLDAVRGQEEAKYALQVAAAGGHGLLFLGPPGAGKSMLARRLVDLLPPMEVDERIEVTSILSAAGRWPGGLAERRPFRAPHHTTSFAGLIGGGSPIAPGEITLAHGGVLFLDELPEFGRESLEGLRQPLEEGRVHIARAARRLTLPAGFQLVAAMNPCPCGYAGHSRIPCHCAPSVVRRYRRRLSGPLLDRIDLRVALQPAPIELLVTDRSTSTAPRPDRAGAALADGIESARRFADQRPAQGARSNASLSADDLDEVAPLDPAGRVLLTRAAADRDLSARAIQSIRRVARTVADLEREEVVSEAALAAALGLRLALP
ncbi:MAG: YifB family Mg chelatase-like AAA ATPase [Planctomycetota bacterium]